METIILIQLLNTLKIKFNQNKIWQTPNIYLC